MLHNAEVQDQKPEDAALAAVLMRYWNAHASKIRSHATIQLSLNKWNEFFGPVSVAELTPTLIEKFILQLQRDGRAPGGVSRVLSP